MTPRILFVSSNIHTPWGGSEVLWYKTACSLLRHNRAQVGVTSPDWGFTPRHIGEIIAAGGTRFEHPKDPGRPLQFVISRLKGSPAYRRKRILQRFRPSLIVHSMGKSYEGIEWMQLAHQSNIAYVNLVQLSSELQWPEDHEVDAYRAGYQQARANCFVSESNKELVSKQLGIVIPRSQIVRNPILVPIEALPFPAITPDYHFALPATLVPIHKGQDTLFEILAQQRWQKRPIQFNLYGKGVFGKSLDNYRNYLGLDNIHFKGHSSDIREIWRTNHLLVMGSRMEGLPLSLVEAMSCGRPAVVPDIAGMSEVLEDNKSGFLAPSPSYRDLDQTLERAWQARHEWEQMGKIGAESIRNKIPFEPAEWFGDYLLNQLDSNQS